MQHGPETVGPLSPPMAALHCVASGLNEYGRVPALCRTPVRRPQLSIRSFALPLQDCAITS